MRQRRARNGNSGQQTGGRLGERSRFRSVLHMVQFPVSAIRHTQFDHGDATSMGDSEESILSLAAIHHPIAERERPNRAERHAQGIEGFEHYGAEARRPNSQNLRPTKRRQRV